MPVIHSPTLLVLGHLRSTSIMMDSILHKLLLYFIRIGNIRHKHIRVSVCVKSILMLQLLLFCCFNHDIIQRSRLFIFWQNNLNSFTYLAAMRRVVCTRCNESLINRKHKNRVQTPAPVLSSKFNWMFLKGQKKKPASYLLQIAL